MDVEHQGCKIHILFDRARGGRSASAPHPFRSHCQPMVTKELVLDRLYQVCTEGEQCIMSLCKAGVLFPLPKEFRLAKEQERLDKATVVRAHGEGSFSVSSSDNDWDTEEDESDDGGTRAGRKKYRR